MSKGWFPHNIYGKDLTWGVFQDGELCGAFETEAEAENYCNCRCEEEEDDSSEYTIVHSED